MEGEHFEISPLSSRPSALTTHAMQHSTRRDEERIAWSVHLRGLQEAQVQLFVYVFSLILKSFYLLNLPVNLLTYGCSE